MSPLSISYPFSLPLLAWLCISLCDLDCFAVCASDNNARSLVSLFPFRTQGRKSKGQKG